MSHRECIFFRILRRFGHKVLFFLPFIIYIFGFREKRMEHISFLAKAVIGPCKGAEIKIYDGLNGSPFISILFHNSEF